MNQDRDDKALEEYLDGESAESQRYAELGDELPPPELDAEILAQAEREVKVTGIDSRRAPPFKAFAWAAVFVVSFSLVLNIVFDQAVQDPMAELEGMAQRSDAPAPASPVAREVAPRALQIENFRASEEIVAADSPSDMKAESQADAQADRAGRVAAVEESDDAADLLAKFASSTESVESKKSRERREAPVAAAAQVPEESVGLGTLAKTDKDEGAGAEALQVVADYLALPSGPEREQSLMKSEAIDDEMTVLRRILDLREAGRDTEALTALAAFRSKYPDHPVSVELEERGL